MTSYFSMTIFVGFSRITHHLFGGIILLGMVYLFNLFAIGDAMAFSPSKRKWAVQEALKVQQKGHYPTSLEHGEKLASKRRKQISYDNHSYSGCSGCSGVNLSPVAGCLNMSPWLILGGAFFLFIIWFVRYLTSRLPASTSIMKVESVKEASILGMEVSENDNLEDAIAQQNWMLAILILLLRGFKELGWKSEGRGNSLTAREIVNSVSKDDHRLPPLRELLQVAELVRFGGRPASLEVFEQAKVWSEEIDKGSGV